MKFTLPNCQLHIAKSSTPNGQCYIANFPSRLHFVGCPNALQTAQVLKKKLAAQCLKFIPCSPKIFFLFGSFLFGVWEVTAISNLPSYLVYQHNYLLA
jgi:hypothetical protein